MTYDTSAARAAANGGARPDPWVVPPDSLPCPAGDPPDRLWCPSRVPPDGFEFLGAVATEACWFLPCPACCQGWVPLVPDGSRFGYRLVAEIGCSAACEAPEILWWQGWRLGDLPALKPMEAGERAWRYAYGALRRVLSELPDRPDRERLLRTAFDAGRWLAAGDLPAAPVADALLAAADRAGFDPDTIAPVLADALTAGRARPGRLPR
jgi:hypothetical protein